MTEPTNPHGGGDRLTRWRLVLGDQPDLRGVDLCQGDRGRDQVLDQLYNTERTGNLGGSSPRVARWLGDIRSYFPSPVVQVMQRDALTRLGLGEMLVQPEMLAAVQPDLNLAATILGLRHAIPPEAMAAARAVVANVVAELERRLAQRTRSAVAGALNRAARTRRPRPGDIDWNRTVSANLRHYQPELGTVVPVNLIGHARRSQAIQREIVLCVDSSGSMAASVIYASVLGSVMAGLRSLRTSFIAFDTSVVDLTDQAGDPVELLFGINLGGGTDIDAALAYAQTLVTRPRDTIVILLSDLFEGGPFEPAAARLRPLVESGAQVIVLLALSDQGIPAHDPRNAATCAELGIPTFGCTPDLFPDLMAAAITGADLSLWAADHDIAQTPGAT